MVHILQRGDRKLFWHRTSQIKNISFHESSRRILDNVAQFSSHSLNWAVRQTSSESLILTSRPGFYKRC